MSLALSAFHKQLKRRTEEPLAWFKDYYDAILVGLLFLAVIVSSIYWLMPRPEMTITLETLEQEPETAITAVALAQASSTNFNKRTMTSITPPKVNINTASQSDLERLPRVGPKLAERIMQYRAQLGKFTTVSQLQEVSGIGEKTLAKMAPFIEL